MILIKETKYGVIQLSKDSIKPSDIAKAFCMLLYGVDRDEISIAIWDDEMIKKYASICNEDVTTKGVNTFIRTLQDYVD